MIEILDENFKKIDILRKYDFTQVTQRFRGIGEFTINARMVEENLYLLDDTKEFYILFDNETVGKAEHIKKDSENEYGEIIEITGRLSILLFTKRVIAGTLKFKGNTAEFVREVIYNEIVKDKNSNRFVNINLSYDNKEYLDKVCSAYERQVTGNYIWNNIEPVLQQDSLGLYFTPNVRTEHEVDGIKTNISEWNLIISAGADRRKKNEMGNVPVIFSESISNIERTSYDLDNKKYCNVAYVAGEGEESNRKWYEVYKYEENKQKEKGWKRSELWIDARDIQSESSSGNLTEEQYKQLIVQRAEEKFKENTKLKEYTSTLAKVDKKYKYGEDYFLGDWCTVIDEKLGITVDVQITEVTKTIQDNEEIIDIGFTYGNVRKDNLQQVEQNKTEIEKINNDIKYLETSFKKIDYVIETGKSADWYYRKWKSGFCELTYKGLQTFSPDNPNGSVYASDDINIPFPFSLPITYSGSVECGDPPCWANMHGIQQTKCTVRVYRGQPYSNIKNYLTIHITGKWF